MRTRKRFLELLDPLMGVQAHLMALVDLVGGGVDAFIMLEDVASVQSVVVCVLDVEAYELNIDDRWNVFVRTMS